MAERPEQPERARVGIRELRQNLSIYVDRVKEGETLVVTEHGHVVAELGPIRPSSKSRFAQLVADRSITLGRDAWTDDSSLAGAPIAFIDSTALSRLADGMHEADALRRYLVGHLVLVTRLTQIEAARASGQSGAPEVSSSLAVRELDESLAVAASRLPLPGAAPLDAINLAAAIELRSELEAFITYDDELANVARSLRLPVVSPA